VDILDDGDVLDVLATDTARRIILALSDSSGTASDIADDLGASVQNVCYHLDRLQSAGLVEGIGSRYSSKGRKMEIYGLVTNPIVVQFGETDSQSNPDEKSESTDETKTSGQIILE
jgi:predicted transcriptional regulator